MKEEMFAINLVVMFVDELSSLLGENNVVTYFLNMQVQEN